MPQVKQSKLDGVPIPGLFEKVATEGDEYRFVSAETGYSQVIRKGDATRVQAFLTAVPPYYEFTLDFRYIVGKNQLMVGIVNTTTGAETPLVGLTAIESARAEAGWPAAYLDPTVCQHFSEMTDDVVRVYNLGADEIVHFFVPQTSLPAVTRDRLIINDQGDGVAAELLGDGNGILLRSRSGRQGVLTIDDQLNLGVDPR